MRLILNRLLLNRCIYPLFTGSKRFAGHSKWANIKHIKQEKDNERMLLFHHIKLQMRVAINEGGSAKASNNLKLAQLIEYAKKVNMPAVSIKSFLEKMEARQDKNKKGIIDIRGPNGYLMLVCFNTNNLTAFRMEFNQKFKKCSGKVADPSIRNLFIHVGNVIVEKKGDLDKAMEDAIDVGAEDVEEFDENNTKYLKFRCDPLSLSKTKNLLEAREYCVLSAEEDYIPRTPLKLSDSDLEEIVRTRNKILSLEDVYNIYDNVE